MTIGPTIIALGAKPPRERLPLDRRHDEPRRKRRQHEPEDCRREDQARALTGTTLLVDGGMSLQWGFADNG